MKEKLEKILKETTGFDGFDLVISERVEFGHYSTSVAMRMAKELKRNPADVAEDLRRKIIEFSRGNVFEEVRVVNPGFINFWLSPKFLISEFKETTKTRAGFGKSDLGLGKVVIVEYSSPNIAKPMHVGHLRSTIIGDAIANIYEFVGYKVIRWNYIGDWGTQFGKLIAAIKLWGNKNNIEQNPVSELLALYVRFNKEEKDNWELQGRGQEEFAKLEKGDEENRRIWSWVKEKSLEEFRGIYDMLGVRFDVELGESFFEKDLSGLVDDLLAKRLAQESEGAVVIPLGDERVPAVVKKADGASLYFTRELAGLKYRIEKYNPSKILHIVGNEQSFHFEQLLAAGKVLGWRDKSEIFHIKFGMTLGPDGRKFATRDGNLIPLLEVIERAEEMARRVVDEKNTKLSEKDRAKVARAVGLAALKYYDLKENRQSDIVFDWDRMLDLRGNSAPYLLYTYARLSGIIKKVGWTWRSDLSLLKNSEEEALIRKVLAFPDVVVEAHKTLFTNGFCDYLYELSNLANRFYEAIPVSKEKNATLRGARVVLIKSVMDVLEKGLRLLGIKALKNI